jgi:hypothetical protein
LSGLCDVGIDLGEVQFAGDEQAFERGIVFLFLTASFGDGV